MNLPIEYKNRMRELLGEAYNTFIKEYDKPCFSALRANTRKITVDELCKLLETLSSPGEQESTGHFDPVPWEKNGLYYNDERIRPGKSSLHAAGLFYIQEPSAMLPVTLLDVNDRNMRVLDLCAAPGGKTTQIADRMKGKGILIANEIISSRAKILSENIERMGVSNALVISADPKDICGRFTGFFDRILVDAPCSGEGMFRKHPEGIDEWSPENVQACYERQSWILDCAALMLSPGGRMVYSTCTFNDTEDEKSVSDFLARHPEFELYENKTHRIFPHTEKGEGHFGAVLIKSGIDRLASENEKDVPVKNTAKKSSKNEPFKPYFAFLEECLSESGIEKMKRLEDAGDYLMFGGNLYLTPAGTPRLGGLRVLRPGLHLGTVIKDRFEPSHALALFLNAGDAKRVCDLDENEAVTYLKGESLNAAAILNGASYTGNGGDAKEVLTGKNANGWTLVLTHGYSLGWGKNVNAMLKNHYPKGLRFK